MQIVIKHKPSYAIANIQFALNENIVAEAGTFVSKTDNISMETSMGYGKNKGISAFFKRVKTTFLGGESFFLNTFTCNENADNELNLAPTLPGDVLHIPMSQHTLFIQSASFLATTTGIDLDTKFQGLKGFFSGESLFFLKAEGSGELLISSYGGIECLDVTSSLIVDTGHIVAFESTLDYTIKKFAGWKSFFLGGEGLVANFRGHGKVWIQTKNTADLGGWLRRVLPPKR